jgi:hypothetical protein
MCTCPPENRLSLIIQQSELHWLALNKFIDRSLVLNDLMIVVHSVVNSVVGRKLTRELSYDV